MKAGSTPGRRKRVAAGPRRPRYLSDRDLDRVVIMLVTLMAEVSALRDRVDTHEALADGGGNSRTADVEGYAVTEARLVRREAMRSSMVRRVFRVLMEEIEADSSAPAFDFSGAVQTDKSAKPV